MPSTSLPRRAARLVPALAVLAALLAVLLHGDSAQATLLGNLQKRIEAILDPQQPYEGAASAVLQPDGKLVHAGLTTVDGEVQTSVVRLGTDGKPDRGFGKDGLVVVKEGARSTANSITLDPEGRLLVAGVASTGKPRRFEFFAFRLLPTGKLDPTFGKDGVVHTRMGIGALAMAVRRLPDGRIVLAGVVIRNGTNEIAVQRLTPTGQLDTTFGDQGTSIVSAGTTANAYGMNLQRDGKIVIAAEANDRGTRVFLAVRMNKDGGLDQGFADHGLARIPIGAFSLATAVEIQPDGKIVLTGEGYPDNFPAFATVRLNPDGSRDKGFGVDGVAIAKIGTGGGGSGMALQPDGKVLVGGVADTNGHRFALLRYNADGSPDLTFGVKGAVTDQLDMEEDAAINTVVVEDDGGIVAVGARGPSLNQTRFAVVHLDEHGNLAPWIDELAGVSAVDRAKPRLSILATGLRAARDGRTVTLRLRNRNRFAVRGRVLLRHAVKRSYGSAAYRARARADKRVVVPLTASGREALRRDGRLRTRVVVSLKGPKGKAVRVARTVTVLAARR